MPGRLFRHPAFMAACLLVGGLGAAAAAQPPTAAAFAVARGMERPLLSPDGGRVADIVRTDSERVLQVRSVDGDEARVLMRFDKPHLDLSLQRWLGSNRLLLQIDNHGAASLRNSPLSVSRLMVVDTEAGKTRVIEDGANNSWVNVLSQEIGQACSDPDHVLLPVSLEQGGRAVERIDVQTGRGTRLAELPARVAVESWWADAQQRVRLAEVRAGDGGIEWWLRQPADGGLGEWRTWKRLSRAEAAGFKVLGFDSDAQRLIVALAEGGRRQVVRIALDDEAASAEPLFELPPRDWVRRLIRHEGNCQAVGIETDVGQHFWADGLQGLLGGVNAASPGKDWRLRQWQGARYLVYSRQRTAPSDNLIGDRRTETLGPGVAAYVDLPAELGLEERYLANGSRLLSPHASQGVLPLVVCLHCELHLRDDARGFTPMAAMLATRGYRVLTPALGSGVGSYTQRAQAAAEYLDAAVASLAADGLIEPDRIAFVGASASAYLGLRWAQKRETPLRAVVAIGALIDLERQAESARNAGWAASYRNSLLRRLGSLDSAQLAPESALRQAALTRAPTLLLHGDADSSHGVEHSRDFARALSKLKLSHRLIEFRGSSSDVDHPPYRIEAYQAIEAWLAKHL